MKKKIAKKTHDHVYHSDDESEKGKKTKATMPKLHPIKKKQESDSEEDKKKSEIDVTPN